MIDKSNWRYTRITRDNAEKYEAPTGEVTYFLATAAETDGKVTVFDAYFPKGSGVPLHIHKLDEELFLVTSGKYKVAVADEEFELGPGEMAIAGIDVPRMFEAITDDAWIIVMTSPAGPAENFIRYMQNLQCPPSEEDIQYVAKEYGVVFGGAL